MSTLGPETLFVAAVTLLTGGIFLGCFRFFAQRQKTRGPSRKNEPSVERIVPVKRLAASSMRTRSAEAQLTGEPYADAVTLIHLGLNAKQIISLVGLPRGEIEVLMRIQGNVTTTSCSTYH